MPGTEKREWAPCTAGQAEAEQNQADGGQARSRSIAGERSSAPKHTLGHDRQQHDPAASTACTTDSGATAIAATWKIQAPEAITMPIANIRELNSSRRRPQRVPHVDRLAPRRRRDA